MKDRSEIRRISPSRSSVEDGLSCLLSLVEGDLSPSTRSNLDILSSYASPLFESSSRGRFEPTQAVSEITRKINEEPDGGKNHLFSDRVSMVLEDSCNPVLFVRRPDIVGISDRWIISFRRSLDDVEPYHLTLRLYARQRHHGHSRDRTNRRQERQEISEAILRLPGIATLLSSW